jgi:hypothetical protein
MALASALAVSAGPSHTAGRVAGAPTAVAVNWNSFNIMPPPPQG